MKGKIRNTTLFMFSTYLVLSAICFFSFFDAEYLPRKYQMQKQVPFLFDKSKYSEYIGGFTKEQINLRKYIHR